LELKHKQTVGFQGKSNGFCFEKIAMEKTRFFTDFLPKDEKFENKIKIICSFNNLKCEFLQGRILTINNTNVSFIEPHKIEITVKNKKIILLYFNKDNLFLYNRTMPITTTQLDTLLKEIKSKVS